MVKDYTDGELRDKSGRIHLNAALERLKHALPPECITIVSISPTTAVLPRGEITVLRDTTGVMGDLGLIKWLTAACCECLICGEFLFEYRFLAVFGGMGCCVEA